MLSVVLYQPEIPPNTGNVIRLCANTGARLHLIEPLGFEIDDRRLRRAGLDYSEYCSVETWPDLGECLAALDAPKVWAFSSRATAGFGEAGFGPDDALLFGPETRGLPDDVLELVPPRQRLRIDMVPGSRSLNLSNAVAVAVFEAWRQNGYPGAAR